MNIEKHIEFDKIKERWMSLAVTDHAKEMIAKVSCYLEESELRKQLKDTPTVRSCSKSSAHLPCRMLRRRRRF